MHSWKRSWTGCWPRPGSVPGARYSMHWTGQNSGHLPHGQQRFTSMNATSRGRFFFSPNSSGMSGTRSSFRRRLMMSIAVGMGASCRRRRRTAIRSVRDPVSHRDRDPDEPAHDGAVQADELQVGAHLRLDLCHQLAGLERFQTLPDREADLVMMAAEEVLGGRPHPTIEDGPPLRVVEQLEDAGVELPIDERGERGMWIVELFLELRA